MSPNFPTVSHSLPMATRYATLQPLVSSSLSVVPEAVSQFSDPFLLALPVVFFRIRSVVGRSPCWAISNVATPIVTLRLYVQLVASVVEHAGRLFACSNVVLGGTNRSTSTFWT